MESLKDASFDLHNKGVLCGDSYESVTKLIVNLRVCRYVGIWFAYDNFIEMYSLYLVDELKRKWFKFFKCSDYQS